MIEMKHDAGRIDKAGLGTQVGGNGELVDGEHMECENGPIDNQYANGKVG